jgi:hypothetical protein
MKTPCKQKTFVMKKIFFALFLMAQNVWAQTDSSSATIVMEPKQQNLNEVQISATRAGANTPTAFQTISKEELLKILRVW